MPLVHYIILAVFFFWPILGCSSYPVITKHNKSKNTTEASIKNQNKNLEPDTSSIKARETKVPAPQMSSEELIAQCKTELRGIPGVPIQPEELDSVCQKVEVLPGCKSRNETPIFHYEKSGRATKDSKKILVLSLIHGDEPPSGTVSRAWMARLEGLESRNTWRVIPIANPDGFKKRTRMNQSGVDLNRNFPSEDWENAAIEHWKSKAKSDPRKYPGPSSASEVETQCIVKHIEDFQPDFIISVHTPFGVLDFDGPRMNFPKFEPLPWLSLGNYPGSLGRYMWVNNKVPVLTIELKGSEGLKRLELFDRLQDISGTVAIQSSKIMQEIDHKKKSQKTK